MPIPGFLGCSELGEIKENTQHDIMLCFVLEINAHRYALLLCLFVLRYYPTVAIKRIENAKSIYAIISKTIN
jgi:hypothetical protein